MTAPEQQPVLDANEQFYLAFTNRDLAAMSRLWFPADWVECVHPGGQALRGWEAVKDGWAAVFNAGANLLVAATDVRVRRVGDVAWVSCRERLAASADGRMVTSEAQATNLFVRHDERWRMVLHHASPLPFTGPPQSGSDVVVN
ncbi:MAG TPA: nuclear transport factor 2 family protein [Methylomirabilota bacterium]